MLSDQGASGAREEVEVIAPQRNAPRVGGAATQARCLLAPRPPGRIARHYGSITDRMRRFVARIFRGGMMFLSGARSCSALIDRRFIARVRPSFSTNLQVPPAYRAEFGLEDLRLEPPVLWSRAVRCSPAAACGLSPRARRCGRCCGESHLNPASAFRPMPRQPTIRLRWQL